MERPSPSPAAPSEPSACAHYGRGCRVKAPCCGAWVGCRLCHNEQFPDHEIDRHAIRSMQCLTCNTIQPCARECAQCAAVMGDYFCGVCNLFDNDGARKKIFHCDDCGICRVGGRENFYHCERCCGCYPHSLNNRHRCVDGSMHRECAICLERTFDSIQTVNVLACGHVLHHSCYREYVRYGNVVCPTCRTSLLSPQAQQQLQAADEALLNTVRDARAANEAVDGEAFLNALRNARVAIADEDDDDEEEDDGGEDDGEEEEDSDMSDAASVETDDIVDFGDLTALRAVAWEAERENDVEGLSESDSDEAYEDARAHR